MNKQILDIYNTYNSLKKYQNYLIKKYFSDDPINEKDELKEEEIFNCKEALMESSLLIIKEKIVENVGNLNYESKIFDDDLEKYANKIATKIDDKNFKINNFTFTAPQLFSIIRNKLAHGDFILNYEKNEIILKKPEGCIHINLEMLVKTLSEIIINLHLLKKEKEYNRKIILNGGNALSRKSNSKEIENFINKCTLVNYNFSRKDYKNLSTVDKLTFESLKNIMIEKVSKHNNIYTIKSEMTKVASIYGYNLTAKLNRITDKNLIRKLKKVVKNSPITYSNFDKNYISYLYGELLTRKLNEKDGYKAVLIGNEYSIDNLNTLYNQKNSNENIEQLKMEEIANFYSVEEPEKRPFFEIYEYSILTSNEIKTTEKYYEIKELISWNKTFEEIITSIIIAKFIALFSNPFDDIYKVSNEYNLERDEILNFGLLDLSSLKPEIINIDYRPLEEIKRKLNNAQKRVLSSYKNNLLNIKDYTSYIEKNNDEKVKTKLTERINNSYKAIEISNEKLNIVANLHNKIDEDYKINYKHFENLAIIEGIRNSIAHGNVKILDLYENDNVLDTKIEFTNIYEGKVCFKLIATCNELEGIFKKENINVILNYFVHKIETNDKGKVLKK